MERTARQSNGDSALLQLSGYTFQQLVVDTVTGLDGSTHEVMFIGGHHNGKHSSIKMCIVHDLLQYCEAFL